jgi:hypothetical protein
VAVAEVEVEVDEPAAKGLCFKVGDAVMVEESTSEDEVDGIVEGVKEGADDERGVTEGDGDGEMDGVMDGVSEGVPCIFNGCSSIKVAR